MTRLFKFRHCLLLALLFMVPGCDEDAFDTNVQKSNGIITRKISLEELKKRPKAYQKMLQYLDRSTDANARKNNIYNNKYEFTIDTDEIIYTEKGDYHSYTFSIYPDDDSKGYVENLFLHLLPDGSYKAFLIQYDLSENDRADMKVGKELIT